MTQESEPAALVKQSLREQFARFRRMLSSEEYERRSAAILQQAMLIPQVRQADVVHLYWPMLNQREIDTRPLVHWYEERGATIVLPKLVQFERNDATAPRMRHCRYLGASQLVVNKWGISEPPSGEDIDLDILDLVIVPALGAGCNGHRIGHGFGFYDEFLRSCPVTKVGLVYDECLVDVVPHEPHDVPLDIIISERRTIRAPFV